MRPRGIFSIKTMFIVYLMTKSNKIEKIIFCVICPLIWTLNIIRNTVLFILENIIPSKNVIEKKKI